MLVRLGLAAAVLALVSGAAPAGPGVAWQGYDDALRMSGATGKPVCIVFYNDKVELNGGT